VGGGTIPTYYHDTANRPAGTITVSGSGASAGYVNRYAVPIFASDCSTVETRDASALLSDYVFRFLEWKQDWINSELRQGAAQPHVYATDIANIEIPVPSAEEQRRIVTVLDRAFASIATATANVKKNLASARSIVEAEVRSLFGARGDGWAEFKIPEISSNLDSQRRPVTKSERIPGDVPYYGASGQVDSVRDHLFDDNLLLVSEDGANLLARTYPIAFSISGKSWVNNHAHILKFDHSPTQRLVEYYLNSISIAPWVSGMAQPKLNQKALNTIPIPLPSENERGRIAKRLDALMAECESLADYYERTLVQLVDLKQSLLDSAFSDTLFKDCQRIAA
jgi:type I restriction enzyme S subunit